MKYVDNFLQFPTLFLDVGPAHARRSKGAKFFKLALISHYFPEEREGKKGQGLKIGKGESSKTEMSLLS